MECEIPLWRPVSSTYEKLVRKIIVILSGKEIQNRPRIEMFLGINYERTWGVTDHIVKESMYECKLRELPMKGNEMFSPGLDREILLFVWEEFSSTK